MNISERVADEIVSRLRDGTAHEDAIVMLSTSIEQARARSGAADWPADLFLEQANVLVNDGGPVDAAALGRVSAALLDLASWSALLLILAAELGDFDLDGMIAGIALVRPPYA